MKQLYKMRGGVIVSIILMLAFFTVGCEVDDDDDGETPSPTSYTITIAEGIEHGSVSVSQTTAAAGATVTLTATPADGYELASLTVSNAGGASVTTTKDSSDTSKYTFIMPESDVTVSAVFVEESAATYTITIADSIEHGSVSAEPTTAAAGTSVTLTVTPADGYKLNTISVKDANSADVTVTQDTSDKSKYTFTMPESNVTVSATFTVIPPTTSKDTSKIPLTLEFTAAGSITITNPWSTLKYTVNGGTLTDYSEAITVENGDKVCFYAESSESSNWSGPNMIPMTIGCDADCYVYGNIMSLVTHTGNGSWDKTATELTDEYAFRRLFQNNTHIKNHASKDLVLPATTLSECCYDSMFYGCTGLTELPEDMLPATTLAEACYFYMFCGCTNLVKAPALPASTLAQNCYSVMFQNCSSLNAITCLATDISASYCTMNWVNGVAASGTFTTPSSTSWSSGVSGIPDGWTRVDAN